MAERTIIEARVIPWEVAPGPEAAGIWGIAVRYSNGWGPAYQVGNRLEAERELARNKRVQNGVVRGRPIPAPGLSANRHLAGHLVRHGTELIRLKFNLCASRRGGAGDLRVK